MPWMTRNNDQEQGPLGLTVERGRRVVVPVRFLCRVGRGVSVDMSLTIWARRMGETDWQPQSFSFSNQLIQ
jgi:hypothetical protein